MRDQGVAIEARARRKWTVVLSVAVALIGLVVPSLASAATVELTPGQTAQFDTNLAVPPLPPKLDFAFVFDTTGTMSGEVSNAKFGATSFFNAVRADSADSMFGVASFEDYPYSTFGNSAGMDPDSPYRRNTDLTASLGTWQTAVNSLSIRNGGDAPEAQVPAMDAAMTGSALTWPTGSTAAGQGISFRDGVPHVIALVSDGSFHNDSTGSDAYNFTAPTYAQTLAALAAKDVRVIAADSSGLPDEADMLGIAADTNGIHTRFNTNGTALYDGIFNVSQSPGITKALHLLTWPVTRQLSCDPLQASIDSSSWASVAGSAMLPYTETISAPPQLSVADLPASGTVDCVVDFLWDGLKIAEQHTDVHVTLPTPDTQITKGPKKKTKKKKATFEFSSTVAGSTFECKLDDGPFEPCTSPHDVKAKKGKHSFEVRATAGGQTDPTPATDSWKVKKKK
ncbi:MAG TPA: hypothetical protein VEK39_00400 [Solirubrobacterales bacterium]|nr:hypothetical protein [Solirubrobacterales bacterium]